MTQRIGAGGKVWQAAVALAPQGVELTLYDGLGDLRILIRIALTTGFRRQ